MTCQLTDQRISRNITSIITAQVTVNSIDQLKTSYFYVMIWSSWRIRAQIKWTEPDYTICANNKLLSFHFVFEEKLHVLVRYGMRHSEERLQIVSRLGIFVECQMREGHHCKPATDKITYLLIITCFLVKGQQLKHIWSSYTGLFLEGSARKHRTF